MPSSLLIATTNPGKIREIRLILAGVPQQLLTLADLPDIPEPPETGTTFAENALQKAAYYARASGIVTVAEDSGLVIDALGGRPGVESARYPGETYAEKFANLFRELEPHPRPWTARFVCSLVVVQGVPIAQSLVPDARPLVPSAQPLMPDSVLFTAEATVEGEITPTPRGTNGFGYDPIFYYPPYGGTLAEQDNERKLAVAHRGKAFRALRRWLTERGQAKK
jgi:XTP/dITP diphosphohydrolase